jgi:hypothetical protein
MNCITLHCVCMEKLSATLYIAPCCSLQHEVKACNVKHHSNITCNLIACVVIYIVLSSCMSSLLSSKNQIDILYLDMIAKDELYNWTSSNT